MNVRDIFEFLDKEHIRYEYYGESNLQIHSYSPINQAKSNTITFLRNISFVDNIASLDDTEILIITNSRIDISASQIVVSNPHRTFFKIIEKFFCKVDIKNYEEKSVIETTNIGPNFIIGAYSYIGKDVEIGTNCVIGNNVSIEGKVQIGNNVTIDSGARIGTIGFGHYLNEDKSNTMIPHLGGVIIGKNSFIGANTIISKGTLTDTVLGENVLVDGLCYIAHNAKIGNSVMIAGGAGVAGSAEVGDGSWISPRSIINAGVKIGMNCFVGINCIATFDVPDNKYIKGFPAKIVGENKDNTYKI